MSAPLPRSSKSNAKALKSGAMDTDPAATLLAEPDPADADSLISTNDPNENAMQNEQTWPTEEELRAGDDVMMDADADAGDNERIPDAESGTTPRSIVKRKKVPKGMSAYQAAWIVDEDEEGDGGDSDGDGNQEDEDDVAMDANAEDGSVGEEKEVLDEEEEEEEMIDIPTSSKKAVAFEDMDMEEEAKQYVSPFSYILNLFNTFFNLPFLPTPLSDSNPGVVAHEPTPNNPTTNSLTNSTRRVI